MEGQSLLFSIIPTLFIILSVGLLLRLAKQPHVISYLLAGVFLGPQGLGFIKPNSDFLHLASLGVDLLLFFVGMEVVPHRLISNWKSAVLGTLLQVMSSLILIWVLGYYLRWPPAHSIMIAFVISLSSTAVVIKLLEDWAEINTPVGQKVLGILLAQDLAIIPMLIIVKTMGGERNSRSWELSLQLVGTLLIASFLIFIFKRGQISLPFAKYIKPDREMQVFASLILCFGLASVTAVFHLSTALGAFIAGIILSAAKETHWVHNSLEPFKVLFVALFFTSIGILIDIEFIVDNWVVLSVLLFTVLVFNTVLMAVVMRMFTKSWATSFYFGSILAQIGEFSFLLVAAGFNEKIISEFAYKITLALIALSLLVSPFWVGICKRIIKKSTTTGWNSFESH